MIGLLFSGQGAQETGMTYDIYKSIPQYRHILNDASMELHIDIPDLLFDENQKSKLMDTEECQPVVLTMSYALYKILIKNISFNKFGIGLSLGEYGALLSAGYMSFNSALNLIKRRGQLMKTASEKVPSMMIAVINSSLPEISDEISKVSTIGTIGVSNVNTSNQIVIGGEKKVVEILKDHLEKKGVIVIPLNVSGAFHTLLMKPIQKELNCELKKVSWKNGTFSVYSTTTFEKFTSKNIVNNLTNQLISTTYFSKALSQFPQKIEAVIEIGPGRTLTTFASRTLKKVKTYRTDNMDRLQETISALDQYS